MVWRRAMPRKSRGVLIPRYRRYHGPMDGSSTPSYLCSQQNTATAPDPLTREGSAPGVFTREGTTMTRSIDSYALRMVSVAGFLVMATLIAPAATHAQTSSPKRASLNTPAFFSDSRVIVAGKPSRTADGESALLGRSAVDVMRQPTMAAGTPVEG